MNMMSVNVSVEMGVCGGSKARFVMAARLVQQRQVKHYTEIRNKWLDVIHQGIQAGKSYDVTLKVQAASTTNSKNSHCVFKVAAHAAAASDDEFIKQGQTLSAGDQTPQFQYGKEESYQDDKPLITVQQSNGGILIKLPGSSAKQVAWAGLFLNLFIGIQIIFLNKPPEEAILLGLLAVVLLHQLIKAGDGSLTSSNTGLLSLIGLMGRINGARAEDPSNNVCLIGSASNAVADGNVLEEGDNFKAAAAFILTLIAIGSASLWMSKRRPKFEIIQGLKRTPVARKSNPIFKIHPKLESETLVY